MGVRYFCLLKTWNPHEIISHDDQLCRLRVKAIVSCVLKKFRTGYRNCKLQKSCEVIIVEIAERYVRVKFIQLYDLFKCTFNTSIWLQYTTFFINAIINIAAD